MNLARTKVLSPSKLALQLAYIDKSFGRASFDLLSVCRHFLHAFLRFARGVFCDSAGHSILC